jgi:hypothetical protein
LKFWTPLFQNVEKPYGGDRQNEAVIVPAAE